MENFDGLHDLIKRYFELVDAVIAADTDADKVNELGTERNRVLKQINEGHGMKKVLRYIRTLDPTLTASN